MFWTEITAEHVWKKHHIRISDAARALEDPYCLIKETEYEGRAQERVVGNVEGSFLTVVCEGDRIVTAWGSSREEVRGYMERCSKESRIWRNGCG